MQPLMATMDSIQPHQITSKSRVVLGRPKAHMSIQYLCGTCRPDTSHIIHDVFIRDGNWEMQHVPALIDCGAISILMALRLRKLLGLVDEPAFDMTLGLNGQVMPQTSNSRTMAFTVQYIVHISRVQASEVLVVPMQAYNLVLGLPWIQSRNADFDWHSGPLMALRTPWGVEAVAVD
jgi:hypothetical protein